MVKGSDLLVAALEQEGVDRIFGVPGEENLDEVNVTGVRARPAPASGYHKDRSPTQG